MWCSKLQILILLKLKSLQFLGCCAPRSTVSEIHYCCLAPSLQKQQIYPWVDDPMYIKQHNLCYAKLATLQNRFEVVIQQDPLGINPVCSAYLKLLNYLRTLDRYKLKDDCELNLPQAVTLSQDMNTHKLKGTFGIHHHLDHLSLLNYLRAVNEHTN